jgi:hypothetical protein
MKLTLKKEQYHLQSYKVLLRNLNQKNAPPTFSHGKGRWGKSLRAIINKGIANTNLPKQNPPIFSNREDGWVIDCKLR